MRICRITSTFVPPWEGLGPGPYELSAAQADLGHDVTVITKYAQGCEAFDQQAPFKVCRIKAKRNLTFSFLAAVKFFSLHLKNRFDLIHNHGESALVLLLLRPLLWLKVPVVSSVHILRKAQCKAFENAQIGRWVEIYTPAGQAEKIAKIKPDRKELLYERLYLKFSDTLAIVNKVLAEELEEEYGIVENVYVILNGVNTAKFSSNNNCCDEAVEIKNAMDCKCLLLFVGVLNGRKGEFDLIEAMQKIASTHNRAKLLVIGDGPTKQIAIEMVGKLQLENHVKFVANMAHTELRRHYLASDLFLLPSYSEGLPKVVLEAMACGTPVAVSDIPANRGLIEHRVNGYIFEAGDADSLASTILDALESTEERENITRNAKTLVEMQFTWQAVARRLDRVYSKLLSEK